MSETPTEIIQAVLGDVESAADAILCAAERGLSDLSMARTGDAAAFDRLQAILCAILEACAFQDLAGQRLSKLQTAIDASAPRAAQDHLLNGPALSGQGLDQAAADAFFPASN